MNGLMLAALVALMPAGPGAPPFDDVPLVAVSSSPSILIQGEWAVEGYPGFHAIFRSGRWSHVISGEQMNSGPYQIRQRCPGVNRAPPLGVIYQIDKDNQAFCSEILELGQDALVLRPLPDGERRVLRRIR